MIFCFQTGIALSYLIWACSSNFALFVLARFVGGISKGNISLCMSVITDVSSVKTRGRGMALVGVAFSLGFIVGPMIGAMFAIFSDKSASGGAWFVLPSLLACGLATGDLLVVAFCLRETLPKVQHKNVKNIQHYLKYCYFRKNELRRSHRPCHMACNCLTFQPYLGKVEFNYRLAGTRRVTNSKAIHYCKPSVVV